MAIETLGAPPRRPPRADALKARILRLIIAGVCLPAWPGIRPERWRCLPGAMPWWEVRQRVGGRVSTAAFTVVVESLLSEGRLIEVWLERIDGRDAPHLLLLILGRSEAMRRPAAQARGNAEILAAEPWTARLAGAGCETSG